MKTNKSMYETVIAQRDEALRLRGQRKNKMVAAGVAVCLAAAMFALIRTADPVGKAPSSLTAESRTDQVSDPDMQGTEATEVLTCKEDLFTLKSVPYAEISADGAACAVPPGDVSMKDVASFHEEMLKSAAAIVEATVVEVHVKQYNFTVEAPGKFENAGGIMRIRYTPHALVTTVRVERILYGKALLSVGDLVTLEDESLGLDGIFGYRKGVTYVIPITLLPEEYNTPVEARLQNNETIVEGDPVRDSQYCSLYPYQPAVEIAVTGDYILPDTWTSVTGGTAIPVLMEQTEYLGWSASSAAFFADRMRLVPKEEFRQCMNALLMRLEMLE